MSEVAEATLQEVSRRAAPLAHDAYSERALAHELSEYLGRRRTALAPFTVTVDGSPYPDLFTAMLDPNAEFASMELKLVDPPGPGPAWDYLLPFERVVFAADGSADLYVLDSKSSLPRRAIARLILRERYAPRSEQQDGEASRGALATGPETGIATLQQSTTWVRRTGVVPFAAALLLYVSEERIRYELDLVGEALSPDPRAGRLPLDRRVKRSARASHGLDVRIARGELSVIGGRTLEVLFETHGLTALDLAHAFGGLKEFGTTALESLRARRYAVYDRRTGVYRPRLEAFLSTEERVRTREDVLPPMPNPQLRTSVTELLAAADARATCPLCGDTLPPGPRGILCARCQAEVSAEPGPAGSI
ncbi:MAG: hypothetical protein L3K19_08090 [Thermoplasmata archaeon]|nr:hypothetical protein [Thermoplasmata archaeon]